MIANAIASRKQLSHPSVLDQTNVLTWMRKDGIRVVGSYVEADQQLRKLEMDGIVDAIATEDGDVVVLRGQKVLSKSMVRGGKLMFCIFDRHGLYTARPHDCHLSKLFLYGHACIDLALLLGNDYIEKMTGNGKTTVLEDHEWKHRKKDEPKIFNNGLIDLIARHSKPEEWFEEYARTHQDQIHKSAGSVSEYIERFKCARRYMLHAPVFERNEVTGEITLVPLNPLPDGIDIMNWKEYIGFDFSLDSVICDAQYRDAYECNLVPLSGKLFTQHRGPLFLARENPDVSTNEVLPIFSRFVFQKVPVELQPTVCITRWLKLEVGKSVILILVNLSKGLCT